jgi:hypothetical protein
MNAIMCDRLPNGLEQTSCSYMWMRLKR